MMKSLKIIIPSFPSEKLIYFRGYFFEQESCKLVIYITKYSFNESLIRSYNISSNLIYGWYGSHLSSTLITQAKSFINLNADFSPVKLVLNGLSTEIPRNYTVMLYDYNKIKNSQIISKSANNDDYFSSLHALIQKDNKDIEESAFHFEPVRINNWMSSSLFAQHLVSYVNLLCWLKKSICRDKNINLKQANFIFAILTDLLLGYVVLKIFIEDKDQLRVLLMNLLEKLVNSLYSLLKWLMGAPAGLKLNNAFNKMLGKYFSYHIQLWWLFLDVSGEKLDFILYVYQYLGYLGFTFQAAMICDFICIATFHSYCIYVYAARLFNIQISGLIALLRLFVGRKYNPLRGGIDSCEYTNQELFVGTVAFTILLLLLPTTAMYYTVFTVLRLLSLAMQSVLAKIIHHIQTMPLYVTILWISRSPKVAGNIFIEVVSSANQTPLILKVSILTKSLKELVTKFKPPVEMAMPVEWTNLVSNVLTGKQII